MGRDPLMEYVDRTYFWIKVSNLDYYDTWQIGRLRMNFVIHSQAEKRKCAYQFFAWNSNYKGKFELAQEKMKVFDFMQKNQDPWDRFKTNRAWSADSFESRSCQLYCQGDVDVKRTENLYRLRMVTYLENTNQEDFSFWVKFPEPVNPFVVNGEVTQLGNLYGTRTF